jgi:uncharacterized protein (TIGR04222 family)
MISYSAAAGDTWGISGPTFLWAISILGVVFFAGTLAYRRRILRGPSDVRPSAIIGELAQTGALPAGATPLDVAVYHAADRRIRPRALPADSWVADAVGSLRSGLERSGLAVTQEARRSARTGVLVLLALLAFGVARLAAGVSNKRPVGFLALILIVLGVATVVLLVRVPHRTGAGDLVLNSLRKTHSDLAPIKQPAWQTYGPAGAAMGVALFGTAALWTADPTFAAAAEVQRQFAGASGVGSSSYYAGAGDAGSGGSSGGGGCGGGGCGG